MKPAGRFAILFLMLAAAPAQAAGLSPSAKAEIDALLSRLAASQCQFYRNGSWYSGTEARDHLNMKLRYLARKGAITSSEEFIAKAGTRSSLSGRPYKVQCPHQAEESSALWLGNELITIRGAHEAAEGEHD